MTARARSPHSTSGYFFAICSEKEPFPQPISTNSRQSSGMPHAVLHFPRLSCGTSKKCSAHASVRDTRFFFLRILAIAFLLFPVAAFPRNNHRIPRIRRFFRLTVLRGSRHFPAILLEKHSFVNSPPPFLIPARRPPGARPRTTFAKSRKLNILVLNK